MAKDKQEWTYDRIMQDLKSHVFYPIYILMGEEGYYIDRITDYIQDNILSETEKEFNLSVFYGLDADAPAVINAAKRFPMMSEHQVIIVKEAQSLKNIEDLAFYLQKPLKSTILVLCYRHGTLDGRKKLSVEAGKQGVVFDSKKLKDYQLPPFITAYFRQRSLDIEQKAIAMLADFVGTDLGRLTGEMEKLVLTLPEGATRVTPEQIERNIGISKDYNNYELQAALVSHDILKANKIIKYFEENPKTNPIQMTLSVLFSFFANLMLAYYAPQKTEAGIVEMLSLRFPWQAKDYIAAMRMYNGVKVMQIIGEIRKADARSKGVENPSMSDGEILKELIYTILH